MKVEIQSLYGFTIVSAVGTFLFLKVNFHTRPANSCNAPYNILLFNCKQKLAVQDNGNFFGGSISSKEKP